MRRLTAASVVAATALTLITVPAQAEERSQAEIYQEQQKFIGIAAQRGTWGAMPETVPAGQMADGSVEAGSSGREAWQATQAGWTLTWIAVSAAGLGIIAFGLDQAGVLPPSISAQLPF